MTMFMLTHDMGVAMFEVNPTPLPMLRVLMLFLMPTPPHMNIIMAALPFYLLIAAGVGPMF